MAKQPRLPQSADGAKALDAAPDYPVGYGRTPVRTRYKPGQSGNPKGRPKGQCNVRTVLQRALAHKMTVRENNQTRTVSRLDAVILKVISGALNGDPKSVSSLIVLLRAVGMTAEAPAVKHEELFTADDEALLADFLVRQGDQAQPTHSTEKPQSRAAEPPSKETKEKKS
jgi:hypothetical protein